MSQEQSFAGFIWLTFEAINDLLILIESVEQPSLALQILSLDLQRLRSSSCASGSLFSETGLQPGTSST